MHLRRAREAVESPGKKMAEPLLGQAAGVHRPRNLDWKRAAALLYGDWGTSKAYVIGLAFLAGGYSSLPIILAVCVLTGLVGINYAVICRYFPDGGGVYSAARSQGRLLAVVGALLLIADLTVTAALSGWGGLWCFQLSRIQQDHFWWASRNGAADWPNQLVWTQAQWQFRGGSDRAYGDRGTAVNWVYRTASHHALSRASA